MERLTWQIRHGLSGRQTKFTSALAPLLGKEFHFSAPVPISLCNPWVFAILLGVGRNASAVGNNTDTGRAICQESHFTRSPGLGSRTSMSCTHRASYSSVFDRQRKLRGWPGSALCPPLPSTAPEARSMSIWREGPAGEATVMPIIPGQACFRVSLIAALRLCGGYVPSFGEPAVALLQSPQPPSPSTILTALLQELENREAHPAPIVLIVDDYQVIEEHAIHQGMSFFLEHLPAKVHLILSSRVDPDLPLARWRVRGQLTEVRAADLRFREVEASQFLGQMLSLPLSEAELQMLLSRTEGWIAGLHLAALTMQRREDRAAFLQAFTGSQRYLLDYVQEEILARLPTSVRDFLLHTAILSRLDASVCQAVTAEPERRVSQQMLEWLERANLFLVSLDEERRSYRLHDLFREALSTTLHTTHPERMPALHHP